MKRFARCMYLIVFLSLQAEATSISVVPPGSMLPLTSSVVLDIDVADISDLYAFQFDVDFNPAVLSATETIEGGLFSDVGVFFSPGVIDNAAGKVTFIADSRGGPGPGISGGGTLARIGFTAVGVGSSSVYVSNVVLLDSNLNDIIPVASIAASVNVLGTPVIPEPDTGVLILVPLIGTVIALKRQRCGG